jgi:hypothetical protein
MFINQNSIKMKTKITFLIAFLLGSFITLNAQNSCGSIIELSGSGMQADGSALSSKTLYFSDVSSIDSIIVEAIYKSFSAPSGFVTYTSSVESVNAWATPLDSYVKAGLASGNPNVFRATMKAADSITLYNTISNPNGIFSYAAYVFRSTSQSKQSVLGGEHLFFYRNGDANPGVQTIQIPSSDVARDVTIKLGISELNNDNRIGFFNFIAGTYSYLLKVQTWDPALGTSYLIKEVVLPAVPGDVTEITISGVSPDQTNGDSYIGGLVVVTTDCVQPSLLCSYTQGYFGNAGGRTCQGLTTTELLSSVLQSNLVLGGGSNTFTFTGNDIQKIYDYLPGGGPAAALNGAATAQNPVGVKLSRKGSFQNILLSQTLTLALNLRVSPALKNVALKAEYVTREISDCSDLYSTGIEGTEQTFYLPVSVVNYLGEGADIADLLALANKALSGVSVSPLSLEAISEAATAINEAFDECRVLVAESTSDKKSASLKPLTASGNILKSGIYPNPVRSNSVVEVSFAAEDNARVSVIDLSGKEVKVLFDNYVVGKKSYIIPVQSESLNKGFYLLKISSKGSSSTLKFFVE